MESIVLKATRRDPQGVSAKVMRRQGKLPAVIYGKSVQAIPIALDSREASKVLREVSSSTLLIIDVDGEQHHTLVRERQRNYVKGTYIHADFLAVSLKEKVTAKVHLHFVGSSLAVKDFGALLIHGVDEVEVESLPQDLPDRIDVDLSSINAIGDDLHVRDLALPPNVEILSNLDDLVVVAALPAAEEEEVATEAPVAEVEPEVIEKGKREEEEEEGEEGEVKKEGKKEVKKKEE